MTPYANPLIQPVPPAAIIANITNSTRAVITTASPHGYASGIYCTINIPYPNVMTQINGKTYFFIVLSATQLIPLVAFSSSGGGIFSFVFLDTSNIGPFSTGPLARCFAGQPQPLPPLPPNPILPVVPFFVPAQQPQLIPAGEQSFGIFPNVSDIIGPNNPPIPPPGN